MAPAKRLVALLLRPLSERERVEVLADLRELREHRCRGKPPWQRMVWLGWQLLQYGWAVRLAGAREPSRNVLATPNASGLRELPHSVWSDLRYALRGFARTPSFTLVALPTIALAIGATTSIFSFADALLLRPLPVREPDRLLALAHVTTAPPVSYSSFSLPDYEDLRDGAPYLAAVAAHSSVEVRIGEGLQSVPVEGEIVSANYFEVLGVAPLLGRTFLPEEDRTPGTHPVIVIGQGLWERRFGGDRSVVGSQILVNGRPFTVVGVAPRTASSIDLGSAPECWVPLMMHEVVAPYLHAFGTDLFANRGTHWLEVLARLSDGADRRAAAAALRSFAGLQAEENPETNRGWSIVATGAGEARAGLPGRRPLVWITGLLAAVVAMVLLIASANVANLLLARAASRQREMGVRLAIGAGRRRLIRQVLTEALALALLGGAGGVILAMWLVQVLPSLSVSATLPGLDVRLDFRVVVFAVGLSLFTGLAFGLVPALQASSVNVTRSGGGTDPIRSRRVGRPPLGHVLVVVQVALSLVLLVGAGLTLRTLWNLRSVPLGFDPRNVRIASVDLSEVGSGPERELELYRSLLDRVRALPGVRSASLARVSPFSSSRMANDIFWETSDSAGSRGRTNADMNVVSEDYFATMRIPVVRGRAFLASDAPGAAVVNEAMAARLWPGQDPIGKRLWSWNPEGPDEPLVVVGVVANGRYYRSWRTADRPFLFMSLSQHPGRAMALHVRGSGPGQPAADLLREAVAELDPTVPPPRLSLVTDAMADAVGLERTTARLLTIFGLLATSIAGIGIFGVVSFTVSRRTREIGVRMALGARGGDVLRTMILGIVPSVVGGAGLGWLGAWSLSRFVEGVLFEVRPRDPVTFAAVTLGMVAVALLATWLPARRATRVDPLQALRD